MHTEDSPECAGVHVLTPALLLVGLDQHSGATPPSPLWQNRDRRGNLGAVCHKSEAVTALLAERLL